MFPCKEFYESEPPPLIPITSTMSCGEVIESLMRELFCAGVVPQVCPPMPSDDTEQIPYISPDDPRAIRDSEKIRAFEAPYKIIPELPADHIMSREEVFGIGNLAWAPEEHPLQTRWLKFRDDIWNGRRQSWVERAEKLRTQVNLFPVEALLVSVLYNLQSDTFVVDEIIKVLNTPSGHAGVIGKAYQRYNENLLAYLSRMRCTYGRDM